jgi:type I restriction enzyme S subunit
MDSQNYVSLKHMGEGQPRINQFGDASEVSSQKYEFGTGDILFGKLRPYFRKVALARHDGICSTDINVIKPTDKVDRDFLFYTLFRRDFIDIADKTSTGTRMPRADWEKLDEMKVALPPLAEQNKISKILYRLDTKIELNNQINQNLEDIAQTLFESWFVKFNPYNTFKNSEVGEIPEYFEVVELGDLIWSGRGYSYTSEFLDKENEIDESYPMINLRNVREGGGFRNDGYKYYTEDSMKDRYKIESGDLILAITDLTQEGRVIGSPALIPKLSEDMNIISQDVAKIEPEEVSKVFLYHLFRTNAFQDYCKSVATGTTVLHLSLKSIGSFEFSMPPKEKVNEFVDIARSIHKKKNEMVEENDNLRAIRETLLPKLMSGEIRVNDIELDELEVDSEV